MAGYAINPAIFRAYDIRGVVDVDLSDRTLTTIGRAVGTYVRANGGRRLVVGRDARESSPRLQRAFQEGLCATGIDVIDIGAVPTPLVAFAVAHLNTDGGAAITASHNPPAYNGVKLRQAHVQYGSEPFSSAALQEIGRLANNGPLVDGLNGSQTTTTVEDAYLRSVTSHFPIGQDFKVVVDGGNGVAGPLAVRVLEACGAEVVPLFIEPDSRFPNHLPDPSKPENLHSLARMVVAHKADVGLALDGDGDRLGVVDHQGVVVPADRVLIALARYLLQKQHGPVVFDVMCSGVLDNAVRRFGGQPVRCKTGYSHLAATVRSNNAVLGGERSGHIIAADAPLHNYDDGIVAAVRLLEAMAFFRQSLAEILEPFPPLAALPDERWPFADEYKFAAIAFLHEQLGEAYQVTTLDGVRIDTDDGWVIVRASNTEPVLTARFEAHTLDRAHELRAVLLEKVEQFRKQVIS